MGEIEGEAVSFPLEQVQQRLGQQVNRCKQLQSALALQKAQASRSMEVKREQHAEEMAQLQPGSSHPSEQEVHGADGQDGNCRLRDRKAAGRQQPSHVRTEEDEKQVQSQQIREQNNFQRRVSKCQTMLSPPRCWTAT